LGKPVRLWTRTLTKTDPLVLTKTDPPHAAGSSSGIRGSGIPKIQNPSS
jgi:hypothetical protein